MDENDLVSADIQIEFHLRKPEPGIDEVMARFEVEFKQPAAEYTMTLPRRVKTEVFETTPDLRSNHITPTRAAIAAAIPRARISRAKRQRAAAILARMPDAVLALLVDAQTTIYRHYIIRQRIFPDEMHIHNHPNIVLRAIVPVLDGPDDTRDTLYPPCENRERPLFVISFGVPMAPITSLVSIIV